MDSYTSSRTGVNLVFNGNLMSVYYAGENELTLIFDINADRREQSVNI